MKGDSSDSRKRGATEADFAAVNAGLEEKIEELARANLELYETARQKSELVANMSHELRTPLNSIIGFADVLLGELRGVASDEQVRYLRNIRQAGHRLLETLSELMNFARIESGRLKTNLGPVAVAGLLHEVVTDLSNATTRTIDFEIDVPDDMPTVLTDEVKLNQILHNLGSNAVKFTPDGGRVTFGARLEGDSLAISVADTGVGICEEDRAVIFTRFSQADTGPARRFEGMGLGLYIVDSLTTLLGGEVGVQSAPGEGSTFTVTIPVERMDL